MSRPCIQELLGWIPAGAPGFQTNFKRFHSSPWHKLLVKMPRWCGKESFVNNRGQINISVRAPFTHTLVIVILNYCQRRTVIRIDRMTGATADGEVNDRLIFSLNWLTVAVWPVLCMMKIYKISVVTMNNLDRLRVESPDFLQTFKRFKWKFMFYFLDTRYIIYRSQVPRIVQEFNSSVNNST